MEGENVIFGGGVGVWSSDRHISPDIGEGIYGDFCIYTILPY